MLDQVSKVDDILEMYSFLNDSEIDFALNKVVEWSQDPKIGPGQVALLVVQLQAIAAKAHLRASYYKNISKPKPGTEEYNLKNCYFTLHESINELVMALKILARS